MQPEFWSTPANFDAVLRVAGSVPEEMSPDEADKFGLEFLDTLRDVREGKRNGKDRTDWGKELVFVDQHGSWRCE